MREARAAQLLATMSARQSAMISRQVLLALTTPPGQRPRTGGLPISAQRILWLAFLGALTFGVASVVSAWWETSGYDWVWFWASLAFAALLIWLLPLTSTLSADVRPPADAEASRAAAIARECARAPLAAIQPSTAALPARLMARPLDALPAQAFASFPFLAVFMITFGAKGLATRQPSVAALWQVVCLNILLMLFGAALGLWLALDLVPMRITANERGLRWGRLKRRSMRWDEMRAFCQFDLLGSASLDGTIPPIRRVYWVASERDTIAWTLQLTPARLRFWWQSTAAEEPTSDLTAMSAWRLCGVIAARSGLPLCDCTPATARLSEMAARLHADDARWQAPTMRRPSTAAASRHAQEVRYRAIRWRLRALFAMVLVAGLGVLLGQPRVYVAQLALARAHPPLFADSLATPTGNWTDGAVGSGDFTFQNGAFVLAHDDDNSNACCAVFAWAAPTVGDAVVQVTVRQVGDAYSLGGSGLILREDATTHTMLVFVVTPDGQWRLERQEESGATDGQILTYHGTPLPEGAIHQGSGATNRLAVLMRGASYAFFINDSFVGVYHDAGPTRGHVGIYTDGLADSATFSDFAVYPAPPPSPLLSV